jgi:REP-associated tyrosine transposase
MARRPRIALTGLPLHVVQRGNNRAPCFFAAEDYRSYLHWLHGYAEPLGVRLHAYVLMTNHVHLLLTPERPEQVSRLMQALGRRYVRFVNEKYFRSGTLWEGRYRACGVHADGYLLACMRYVELNPVRAGLAASPELYRWSSYRGNALGEVNALLIAHPLYAALGADANARQTAYRELFSDRFDEKTLAAIRAATHSGHLLADEATRKKAESLAGAPLGPAPRGRPWPKNKSTLTPIT